MGLTPHNATDHEEGSIALGGRFFGVPSIKELYYYKERGKKRLLCLKETERLCN